MLLGVEFIYYIDCCICVLRQVSKCLTRLRTCYRRWFVEVHVELQTPNKKVKFPVPKADCLFRFQGTLFFRAYCGVSFLGVSFIKGFAYNIKIHVSDLSIYRIALCMLALISIWPRFVGFFKVSAGFFVLARFRWQASNTAIFLSPAIP